MALIPRTAAEAMADRDRAEREIERAVALAVRRFLALVRKDAEAVAMATASLTAAAAGDYATLGQTYGWWVAEVDASLVAAIRKEFYAAHHATADGLITASSLDGAESYLARVRDRLVRGLIPPLPDDAFDAVRSAVSTSLAQGWSRPRLAARISAELGWEANGPYWRAERSRADKSIDAILDPLGPPGTPAREHARLNDPRVRELQADRSRSIRHLDSEQSYWKVRATRIARTEATGAANYGTLTALHQEGAPAKEWLATPGLRTRPEHARANGQIVLIDAPFVVGGHHLMMPGDPSGPAHLVINCRCTMLGASAPVAGAEPAPPSLGLEPEPEPDLPEWLGAHRALVARLPRDRSTLGSLSRVRTPEMLRDERIADSVKRAGGTVEELSGLIDGAEANVRKWTALREQMDITPGITRATSWPDDMKALAKDAGFGRRQPKNVWRPLSDAINRQTDAIDAMRYRRGALINEIDLFTTKVDFTALAKAESVKFDANDLDDLGRLGRRTEEALDTVIDAGRLLDEQIALRSASTPAAREVARLRPEFDRLVAERDVIIERQGAVGFYDDVWDILNAQRQAINDKIDPVRAALRKAEAQVAKEYAQVVREVLADVRSMGGEGSRYHGTQVLKDRMKAAEVNYPEEWLQKIQAKFRVVNLQAVTRGYNRGGYEIALSPTNNAGGFDTVATHELGHSMELAIPGLRGLEWALHYRRSASLVDSKTVLHPAKDLPGYPGEFSHADKWSDPYTGRVYSEDQAGVTRSWEVFTTGAESLFEGSKYFSRAAHLGGDDAEFRHFVLGALSAL